MGNQSSLQQLLDAPGAPLVNWREIVKEINEEFSSADAVQRVALLDLFKTTMDIAESTIVPQDLDVFREARRKNYSSFIVQESLIGENVCIETLHEVTAREVKSGRMAPDHNLRKMAEERIQIPHPSRAELQAMAVSTASTSSKTSGWRRLLPWSKRG